MTPDKLPPLLPAWLRQTLAWTALYIVLVASIFNFPLMPSSGLDPSWRMALGYLFEHGMQFGHDVVFTYGPLGFVVLTCDRLASATITSWPAVTDAGVIDPVVDVPLAIWPVVSVPALATSNATNGA